jgi:GNAT superfamily N-acetyltransferase
MDKKLSQKVSIRLATAADVDALTELHCASFGPEDNLPAMLGKDFVQATFRWQVNGKEAYTLVGEDDGKLVGLVAVCDGSFSRPMLMACLPEFILSLLKNPFLLFRRKLWRRLFRYLNSSAQSKSIADHPGFAQMIIGAVDAAYRGKNVFAALIEATKKFSKARGSRAIRAGIYKTNTSSRRVFVKCGWTESPELETHDTVFYVAYLDADFPSELGINN